MKTDNESAQVLVITFPSTHQALKCDRTFKSQMSGFQLMPVPRQISSSCGLAARLSGLSLEQLLSQLAAASIEYEEVYILRADSKLERLIAHTGEGNNEH